MEDATSVTRRERPSSVLRLAAVARHERPRLVRRFAAACLGSGLLVLGAVTAPSAHAAAADSARALAQRAREEAARDDHAAAIADATSALALDASLEPELALLVANQLTWADRPAEAIPWYRKCVARDPADRDARLGLARALSWVGELDDARAEYERLVAASPGDLDARLGVARTHAWAEDWGGAARAYAAAVAADSTSVEAGRGLADAENRRGRPRVAEKLYRELLAQDPDDAESRTGLARALWWMGESEAALVELRRGGGKDATELRGEVQRDEATSIEAGASRWTDADAQVLESATLGLTRGFGAGRRIVAEGALFRAHDPATPTIAGAHVALGGDWRKDRAFALHASAGMLDVGRNLADSTVIDVGNGETRDADAVKSQYFLWDTWATWTPADRWRVDLSHSRIPVETPRALARGIRADVLGLGADHGLGDRVVMRGSLARTSYTDGNLRFSAAGETEAGPFGAPRRVRVWVGAGASYLSDTAIPDHGYYSPDTYDAFALTGRVAIPLGRATLEGSGRLASEREAEGGRFGVFNGGGDLRVPLGRGWGLSVYARRSTSRFDTSGGYAREGWGFSLSASP
ncbi:MAG: tetratricopeptide repeat protein [bacterium]